MPRMTQDFLGVIIAMVLASIAIVVIGADVRQMKEHELETKAESCFQRYAVNGNTGEVYLAEDFCAEP